MAEEDYNRGRRGGDARVSISDWERYKDWKTGHEEWEQEQEDKDFENILATGDQEMIDKEMLRRDEKRERKLERDLAALNARYESEQKSKQNSSSSSIATSIILIEVVIALYFAYYWLPYLITMAQNSLYLISMLVVIPLLIWGLIKLNRLLFSKF